jgi:sodium-dependent phosphate cotransporter
MIVIFLFSIELMGKAFSSLGKDTAESILLATSNPFIGLFIGLLVTALIQSSSTITTMTVAMVASGALSLTEAVPIIMGANIGTTLTSTIVSLAYINKKEEFRRAIEAGTIHDFFNIFTVALLFPLEYHYGFVSWLAQGLTFWIIPESGMASSTEYGFRLFELLPVASAVIDFIGNPFISIGLSFLLLVGSIKWMSSVISKMLMGEDQQKLRLFIFDHYFRSFGWGVLLTGAVQSSSVTTSLVVPFAATGKIRMDRIMPFILGANIGTTITAFIAVLFQSEVVISIAITHLVINIIGVLIFLPFPFMSRLLIRMGQLMGTWTMNHRIIGFLYVMIVFFLLPFTLIYANRETTLIKELTYETQQDGNTDTTVVIVKFLNQSRLPDLLTPSMPESDNKNIQNVYINDNILFIDHTFFIINEPGYCWDDDRGRGKFRMCIKEILPTFQYQNELEFDSVLVYHKEFYDYSKVDSVSYRYFISAADKLLLKTEKLDQHGTVLMRRQLINISE